VLQNWPLKLTSLMLAVLLWMVATAEQPASSVVSVLLVPQPPPGRSVSGPLPTVSALVVGSRRELLKLTASPVTITRIIPDTVQGSSVTLELRPGEVEVPRGSDVRVQDVEPRQVTIRLDSVAHRSVPVHPEVRIDLDSGGHLIRTVQVFPGTVTLTGPIELVQRIDSVVTVPLRVARVDGVFERSVTIDTTGFGPIRVIPPEVTLSFEVKPETVVTRQARP
jgi:YbbR domain-containing protein